MSLTVFNMPILTKLKLMLRYNKKKIAIAGLALIVAFITVVFYSTFCDAPNYDHINNMIREICSNDSATTVINDVRNGVDLGEAEAAASTLNGIMVSVAISIFFILWCMSLVTSFLQQQAYGELVVKRLIVLVIGVLLISNARTICTEISNLGGSIASEIAVNAVNTQSSGVEDIIAQIDEQMAEEGEDIDDSEEEELDEDGSWLGNIWAKFSNKITAITNKLTKGFRTHVLNPFRVWSSLVFPWCFAQITKVLISVFTKIRAVEIMVLSLMAPIPFAFIAMEPLGNGPGMRFLKNIGALSLQGAVMIIIAIVCQGLAQTAMSAITVDNISSQSWQLIGIGLVEVGLLMRSLQISQKAFGLQ